MRRCPAEGIIIPELGTIAAMKTLHLVLILWRTLPLTQPVLAVDGVLEFGEFRLLKPTRKLANPGTPFLLRKSEALDE